MTTTRTLELGPATARLTLHTGRQGVAAAVGHDLVLGVGAWNGTVSLDGGTITGVTVHAETSSLTVIEGHGGAKPLSAKDRAKIESEAGKTLHGATVDLVVTTPEQATGTGTLTGELTVAAPGHAAGTGQTHPFTLGFESRTENGQVLVRARGELVQSQFGIKPYSAMLGALKLRDMVEVHVEAAFPA